MIIAHDTTMFLLLQQMTEQFTPLSTTPQLDAQILLETAIQQSRAWIYAHPEYSLSEAECTALDEMIQKRLQGIPVAYITHTKEFFGRAFFVDERVLIPRPETETLAQHVIEEYTEIIKKNVHSEHIIVDVGTGSGCIAITLKKEFPHARVLATDLSTEALTVAQHNATVHDVEIEFFCGDLFTALPTKLHQRITCLVSNPPYVAASTVDAPVAPLTAGLQHEPRHALVPRINAADAPAHTLIQRLVEEAPQWMSTTALICMEIGYDQGASTHTAATHYFPHAATVIAPDLAGHDRFLITTL